MKRNANGCDKKTIRKHKEPRTINRGEYKLRLFGHKCRMNDNRVLKCSESWKDRTSEEDHIGNGWTTLRNTQWDGAVPSTVDAHCQASIGQWTPTGVIRLLQKRTNKILQ